MSDTLLKAMYKSACKRSPELVRHLHGLMPGADPTQRSYYYKSMKFVLAAMAGSYPADFAAVCTSVGIN